jgi:hypothetical protein
MSEEYQRLQEAASAVKREISELEQNHSISSAAELAALERRLDLLAVKRSSLSKALILLRCVNNPRFQQKQKELIRQLPHKGCDLRNALPSAEKPCEGFTKNRAGFVSSMYFARYFEWPDTTCSLSYGQGFRAAGFLRRSC